MAHPRIRMGDSEMRFTCQKDELARALSSVQRAISARGPMPILANVLLTSDGQGLRLSGTDLNLGIETHMAADIATGGSITVPARNLADIVGKLPNAEVTLTVSDRNILVTCQRAKFTLATESADQFPSLPQADAAQEVRLPASVLRQGIHNTVYAAANRDDMSVVSGVHIAMADGVLEMVATDGYRLAAWRYGGVGSQVFSATIPAKAMSELERLLGQDEGDVLVAEAARSDDGLVGGTQMVFTSGGRKLTTRRISGQYPNYRQVIPAQFRNETMVDRLSLLKAVDRTGTMASERDGRALRVTFTEGALILQARNAESGEAEERVDAELRGDSQDIVFNAQYLQQALERVEGETVVIKTNGPVEATMFQGADDRLTALVMPIRS
ncbi:MAG: DNA polymerase III subunit beta [Candidatus Sericytochromatia bacterium]|nr:DNA polymerase III subunit beta [Candidatus Sericytochromatia bacterium]